MADQKCMAILFELILSTIACVQLHVTMLNVHGEYSKCEAIRKIQSTESSDTKQRFFL